MPGLFAKAAEATSSKSKKTTTKKNTTWVVGDPEGDAVGKSVHELVKLTAEEKAIKAKMGIHKTVVKNHAEQQFITAYADLKVPPETPMIVQNSDGEKVTFVVQDRSGQYAVKDEQREALVQLIGEDSTDDLLYDEVSIGFNREVLAKEGVSEAVEKALESVIRKLTKEGKLGEDDELVSAEVKTAFKPGTMARIPNIVGADPTRMKAFLDAAGSSSVRYVKP